MFGSRSQCFSVVSWDEDGIMVSRISSFFEVLRAILFSVVVGAEIHETALSPVAFVGEISSLREKASDKLLCSKKRANC